MPATGTDVRRRAFDDNPGEAQLIWAVFGDEGAVTFSVRALNAATANPEVLDLAAAFGNLVSGGDEHYLLDVLALHRADDDGASDCPWVKGCRDEPYLNSAGRTVLSAWAFAGRTDEAVFAELRRIYARDLTPGVLVPAGEPHA